jgi:hypothetical protein
MGTSLAPEKMTGNGSTGRREISARRVAGDKIGQEHARSCLAKPSVGGYSSPWSCAAAIPYGQKKFDHECKKTFSTASVNRVDFGPSVEGPVGSQGGAKANIRDRPVGANSDRR